MTIRHSAEWDFNRIMEIYCLARRFMAEHGNPNQWGPTNWLPEELIHSDIKNRNSYVCFMMRVLSSELFISPMERTSSQPTVISLRVRGSTAVRMALYTVSLQMVRKGGSGHSASAGHSSNAAI